MVLKIFKNIKKQFNKVFKRKNTYEKLIDDDTEEKFNFTDVDGGNDLIENINGNNYIATDEYNYVPNEWISEVAVTNENELNGFADFDREVEPWEDPVIPEYAQDHVPKQSFKNAEHPTLGYVSLKINDMGLELYTDMGSYNAWEEAMIMDTEDHMTRGWSMQFPIERIDETVSTKLKMDKLRFSTLSLVF